MAWHSPGHPRFPLRPTTSRQTRHLERRLSVSGLERGPGCHPERSEGSLRPASQTLRCAQGDRRYLQMSNLPFEHLTDTKKYVIIVIKYSGIYNIPIIPPVVTCTIFEKGKQEVFGRAYAPTMCNNTIK